jgi:preprotein translocase subunit SecD
MRTPTKSVMGFRKAGLLGLFVCLALADAVAPGLAQRPSLLEQLEKGYPAPSAPSFPQQQDQGGSSPPPRKSLLPPLRIQVQSAEASFDKVSSEPVVVITMAPRSGRMFHELTLKYIGRRLVLRVDGKIVAEPIIREEIKGGVVQISGSMTLQDAADMAKRLSRGEAKIEVELVSD